MANSKSVDELYLKLGLDLSGLDKDFVTAQNTVKTNVGRLKGEQNRIKLRMDVDTANLGPAATKAQRLAVVEKGLTKQLQLQKQVVELTTAQYNEMAAAKGKSAKETQRLETQLLKEQKALAGINSRLKGLNQEGTIPKTVVGIDQLQSSLLQLGAVAATGVGVLTFVKNAQAANEAIFDLHERLGISVTDAEELDNVLKVGGVSADAFTGVMMRLNKQILTAGENGNDTTKTLAAFGVSITDASGNLLPMNEALDKLAIGYAKAAESGQQEAYITQVLGARGQELVPLLREMEHIKDRASRIKGGGLMDPEEAHKLAEDWADMSIQIDKLAASMGSALLPALKELVPALQEGASALADFMKENPSGTTGAGAAVGTLIAGALAAKGGAAVAGALGAGGAAAVAAPVVGTAVAGAAIYNGTNQYKKSKARKETEDILGRSMTDNDALLRYNEDTGHFEKQTAEESTAKIAGSMALGPFASPLVDTHVWQQVTEEEEKEIKLSKEKAEVEKANGKQSRELNTQKLGQLKDEAKALKINQDLELELFKLTHTDIVNEIADIAKKAAAYREAGADELELKKYIEAEKARVMENFQLNVIDKVNEVWQSSLDIRLAAIDKEKKAWQAKGLAEVASTKWAEEQKKDALRSSASEFIKDNRKRLEELRDAMRVQPTTGWGLDKDGKRIDFNFKHDSQTTMAELSRQWIEEDRAKLGIKAGDVFSPELIQTFAQMKKYTANQLIPGLEGTMPLPVPQLAQLGQGGGATIGKQITMGPQTINVSINNPLVQDNASITELADQVADKIGPAIVEAIGGNDNGY